MKFVSVLQCKQKWAKRRDNNCILHGAGIAQWLQRRTRDWKVPGSNPRRSGGTIFFPRVNFLCSYFGIRSTPVLPQLHVKDSGHSAKSAGGRLQLKHACTFRLWLYMKWRDMVYGYMVYTERAETAAVSCGTSHVSTVSTPPRWVLKKHAIKSLSLM